MEFVPDRDFGDFGIGALGSGGFISESKKRHGFWILD
jgi:hypothetical protein